MVELPPALLCQGITDPHFSGANSKAITRDDAKVFFANCRGKFVIYGKDEIAAEGGWRTMNLCRVRSSLVRRLKEMSLGVERDVYKEGGRTEKAGLG